MLILTGTITAFAGPVAKIPAGWIVCDGALYDRTDRNYTDLFNAIGVSWGGDGGNKFAVPDLRGHFLRGVSDNSQIDPDAASRDISRHDLHSGGNSGNAVGSKQNDELHSHAHSIQYGDHPFMDNFGPAHTNSCDGGDDVAYTPRTIVINPTGGNETRPKNAYVYYIIKL